MENWFCPSWARLRYSICAAVRFTTSCVRLVHGLLPLCFTCRCKVCASAPFSHDWLYTLYSCGRPCCADLFTGLLQAKTFSVSATRTHVESNVGLQCFWTLSRVAVGSCKLFRVITGVADMIDTLCSVAWKLIPWQLDFHRHTLDVVSKHDKGRCFWPWKLYRISGLCVFCLSLPFILGQRQLSSHCRHLLAKLYGKSSPWRDC